MQAVPSTPEMWVQHYSKKVQGEYIPVPWHLEGTCWPRTAEASPFFDLGTGIAVVRDNSTYLNVPNIMAKD